LQISRRIRAVGIDVRIAGIAPDGRAVLIDVGWHIVFDNDLVPQIEIFIFQAWPGFPFHPSLQGNHER